jgi:broad specificity phosphatase PhoE
MRLFILASAICALATACVSTSRSTVSTPKAFVIRHFQKEVGNDPRLTPKGQANAVRLAERLSGERIVAVYSTDTRRTRETAAPTVTKLGLMVALYPATDYAALAQRVASQPESVLIVGHSNTVPDIVAHFSGAPQPPMDESQYGTLFVVDLATKAVTKEQIGD